MRRTLGASRSPPVAPCERRHGDHAARQRRVGRSAVAQVQKAPGSWADGDRYESYVGRWSRPVARRFVAGLAMPAGRRWLDVGSGTGVLTRTVLDLAEPSAVRGIDRSPAFVRHAAAPVPDPRASFATGAAAALPLAEASVDVVVSGLVLNFLPDATAAVADWHRVAVPGAVVAAYVWDYADGMQMMRTFW